MLNCKIKFKMSHEINFNIIIYNNENPMKLFLWMNENIRFGFKSFGGHFISFAMDHHRSSCYVHSWKFIIASDHKRTITILIKFFSSRRSSFIAHGDRLIFDWAMWSAWCIFLKYFKYKFHLCQHDNEILLFFSAIIRIGILFSWPPVAGENFKLSFCGIILSPIEIIINPNE